MRVQFNRNYDFRFESGAEMAFPSGWEGTVKQEVGDAAVKAGAATKLKGATPAEERSAPEPTLPGNLPVSLAEPQALTPNLSNADDSE